MLIGVTERRIQETDFGVEKRIREMMDVFFADEKSQDPLLAYI